VRKRSLTQDPCFYAKMEAHYFTVDQDALFQTTARSKGLSTVRLSQNLPNFLDAYGRDGGSSFR